MRIGCGELFREIIYVLDFDGVITKLDIDWGRVRAEVSRVLGYPVDSLIDFFKSSFGSKRFFLVSKIVERYELDSVKKAEPYKDVSDFLSRIRSRPIYIASMQSEKAIRTFLRKHSLSPYFKDILARERFGSKYRQLKFLINNLNLQPTNILLVDDSKRNISACKKLGLKCFWLQRNKGMTLLNCLQPSNLNSY